MRLAALAMAPTLSTSAASFGSSAGVGDVLSGTAASNAGTKTDAAGDQQIDAFGIGNREAGPEGTEHVDLGAR